MAPLHHLKEGKGEKGEQEKSEKGEKAATHAIEAVIPQPLAFHMTSNIQNHCSSSPLLLRIPAEANIKRKRRFAFAVHRGGTSGHRPFA